MDLLFQADPDRLLRWVVKEKIEFFNYYLFKHVDIILRDHDEDPGDFPENFHTIDDYLYIRVKNLPGGLQTDQDEDGENYKENFIYKMLKHLADMDHSVYMGALVESTSVLPAEMEEELFRRRSVRLAEKGFLPYDRALSVYAALPVSELLKKKKKDMKSEESGLDIIPSFTSGMLDETDYFSRALKQIDNPRTVQDLQGEFAGLCNRLAAADQIIVRERKQLDVIVKKACSYISICLEKLSGSDIKAHENHIISSFLMDLFGTGYTLVSKLKRPVNKWLPESWCQQKKLPLSFWGEEWFGILGGVLIDRPQYFDNFVSGHLYREFQSLKDIEITESALNHVISMDDLLLKIDPEIDLFKDRFLTCYNLILTSWVIDEMKISDSRLPGLSEFRDFFTSVLHWQDGHISDKTKERFLSWLSGKTDMDKHQVADAFGKTLELMFSEIEHELGAVRVKDLEPKYIHLFCID